MGSVVLTQLSAGFYAIGPADDASKTFAYFLIANPPVPSPQPTLQQSWDDPALFGWYLFLPQPIKAKQAAAFAKNARLNLPTLAASPARLNPRGLVWVSGPDACADPAAYILLFQPTNQSQVRLPFRQYTLSWCGETETDGFGLQVSGSAGVTLDATQGVVQITTDPCTTDYIQVLYNGAPQGQFVIQYLKQGWNIAIALTGASAGALMFRIALDFGQLRTGLLCGMSYAFPGVAAPAAMNYPLSLAPPSQAIGNFYGFNVSLHPLYPYDDSQTAFWFDLVTPQPRGPLGGQPFSCSCFQSVNGSAVVFQAAAPPSAASGGSPAGSPATEPARPPGFVFARTPAPGAAGSPFACAVYLTPIGTFQLAAVGGGADSVMRGAGPGVQVLCGLSAQEFLWLQIGDVIEFVPNQPAWAPGFSPSAPLSAADEALTADATTSRIRFPLEGDTDARGYFAQPSASVYYAPLSENVLPTVVTSLLSTLPRPALFPMVPYGGASPSAAADSAAFTAFEAAVLGTLRHKELADNIAGPVFTGSGALQQSHRLSLAAAANFESLEASNITSAVTPQGMIADLNADGTWNQVQLAKSPQVETDFLTFRPPAGAQVINRPLGNVLLQDQLFLVVSLAKPLGTFANLLTIAGFNFLADIDPLKTLLIFKYNTSKSLRDLVDQTTQWAHPEVFVGGVPSSTEALRVRASIQRSIAVAEAQAGATGNPFGYFNTLVDNEKWTGMLAMNCAIDGNGMPADFAMLLGGIPGQLRSHHLGLDANRISRDGGLHIDQSSLFGVIHYQNESTPSSADDFEYAVETLTAVFSNSRLTQLAVEVGLTINKLFGRDVVLVSDGDLSPPPPANTLVISGQYQSQDGVGTVSFSSQTPFVFASPINTDENGNPTFARGAGEHSRVIEKILINQASLVPVNSGSSSPGASSPSSQQVQCGFHLGGQLWFREQPFAGCDIDLFSYGVSDSPSLGTPFSDLTVNIAFTLDESGAMVPGTESVLFQPQLFSLAPVEGCIRVGSLLNSLPMQLSRFVCAPPGSSAAGTGSLAVHVLELEGVGGKTSPPSTSSYPYVTQSPQYALEFDLPLGSLGALSDVHAGLSAKLILGWGPSPVVPDCDAAAVFVQLPQAMAGYGGFNLQGILQTTFGDANLLKVDLETGPVYAILFNNVKLSVLGYGFPPGVLIDFTIFAGQPSNGQPANSSNIAWFLAATQPSSQAAS